MKKKVKAQSLLDLAKGKKYLKRMYIDITPETVELAVAWAKRDISYSQVAHALGIDRLRTAKVYHVLAKSLAMKLTGK